MENEDTTTTTPAPTSDEGNLGDAGKRALDAERKARKEAEKRAAAAEARIKDAEDADKSEVERLQGQLAEATKERDAAVQRADRFEVGLAKGLSLAQARRLVGATKDDLEADADELRVDLGLDKKDDTAATKRPPTEDLKPGATNAEDEEVNGAELADKLLSESL